MIHSTAEVQTENFGKGSSVWQYSIILKNAIIGENCNINCHVFIENDVIIGNNVTVKSGVQLWDGIRIEDNVFIGPNATFTNDMVPRSKEHYKEFDTTILEKGASIGANATVIGGNTIGRYSLIGAGSVITRPVPAFTVWYGNPAKQKGYITREGLVLNNKLIDHNTGKRYILSSGEPILI